MSVKKIDSFNTHEQPESNTDSFGIEAYLNANWEKTKEAVNNNAEELIQSQKDIDANKNDIENINSKNKSQDDTIEALKAENKLIKEQIPSANISGNSIYIEDSSNLDFDWKIRGGHYQKQTIQNDNLLILEDTTITTNGITLTIKDGVITINGTSTASTNIDFKIKKKLKAGTYWHLVQRSGDAPSGNVGFLVMKSGGVIATINGRGGASFTLNEDTEVFYRIWTDKNNIISNVAYKCLISEGSDSKQWVQGIPDSPSVDYPSEIETVGSNVNHFNINGEITDSNASHSIDKNSIIVNAKYSYGYISQEISNLEANAPYILHFDGDNSPWIVIFSSDEQKIKEIYSSNKISFNCPQNGIIKIRIYATTSQTSTVKTFSNIKLEKGTKASPYSPYGMGSVEINVINKNFINMQKKTTSWSGAKVTVENNKIIFVGASDGSLGLSFSSYESKIKMLKGNKITYSSKYVSGSYTSGNTYYNLKLIYQDGTSTVIYMDRNVSTYKNNISKTIILEKDVVAYQINGSGYTISGLTNELVYEFQLEIGDSASETVEQSSQTAIMPIQQEMLENDYIADLEHHEWGKYMLTGNETNISISGSINGITQFNIAKVVYKNPNTKEITARSNYFLGVKWDKSWTIDNCICNVTDGYSIRIMTSEYTTVEDFKAWLKSKYDAGTPVIIYYKLAEPLNLELTAEQKAIRDTKLYTYKNITNISLSDELASVEVEYKKDQDTINKNYENRLAALEAASIS